MTIFDETWSENDYMFRNKLNLTSLPKNHVEKLKDLKFDFVEYKAHSLIACHLYERMTLHCMNQYGLFKDFYRPECLDSAHYFKSCVELNAAYGKLKKYYPEQFVSSGYARPVPQFEQIDPTISKPTNIVIKS
ncbi:hypothetical protein IMG5_186670 [Ichthyophthirius multifiliis]|uniref:Uncharacterized protein n=1 Tax=Ichthyophthirius multifiliis TaxID=5932 RepID=G0R3N2_ICHMU|nr:hypothetical protein IMG5_186670 [Ichthyophthirius multifiliis]EGR27915.1 hypothetical protein IMG5_186670 [Ichthyophthirius multifiliis]|eukprot:XP_004027260.1 hypothetical protein IMG5_186670 [Ichthyophthirius multifiliis]